jgi:septal ring factor EnvC (AmiA/AmiB activator)
MGRVLTYYDYLNKSRIKEMDELSDAVRSLADVQARITGEINTLNQLAQTQEKESVRLNQAKAKRVKALSALQRDIADDEKRLAALLLDEKNLSNVVAQVDQVVRDVQLPKQSSFAQLKGRLGWPARGDLVQRFGDERFQGRMRWNGVLIGATEGAEVQVIFPGRIVFADWLRGFGLMTIVDHGSGYMSLYGHNQSLGKQVGDWVEAGEVIATVGNSGGHGDQGLYFEIRHKGKAVDPRTWCKRG